MPKMCPHFHLSLQSGCDTTLERMNRRYRSAEYAEKCGLLRKYLGNPALTTDVNEQHAKEYEKSMLGGELKVLLEEEVEINGEQWYIGHSMEYIKTAVKKQDNYSVNDIITVKAEEFLEEHTLTGEVLGVE